MNGVIYCRVSSKDQVEGTSLESQEFACKEYAKSKNINVQKIFIEEGESAKFADRTQLLELINFCRENKGKVEVLLVWKIDRFARNVTDHFNVKATLMKYGVRIVSVTEPIDSNPEGKLMETILAGFAQFDNDIRATRTIQGMRRKIQEGIFPWKPPLGYKTPGQKGEKKTKADEPEQPIFSLLQKTWKTFVSGAYTKAEIGRLMESWGIQTAKGRPLSAQSIDNLFSNPYYAGILVDPWSGDEYEGQHTPMVSREDFAQVQCIIQGRNRSVPHQKVRSEFPLRGVIRCDGCSRYLTGSFSRGRSRRYGYYRCHNKKCTERGKSYQTTMIQGDFDRFLTSVEPKRELMEKLEAVIVQVAKERQILLKTKKARLNTDLSRVNRQVQELIRMRTEELITNEEFLIQKKIINDRRIALESRTTQNVITANKVHQQIEEIKAPLANLTQTWSALPDRFRERFQRLLLPVGFLNGKVRTAELGLLFRVFREFPDPNSTLVPPVGKFWNQILAEIKLWADLFRDINTQKEGVRKAVPKDSSEYPSRDELEPKSENEDVYYKPIEERWGGPTLDL